jgi:Rrf2 family protein
MFQLARTDSETPVPCSQLACEGKMPERFLLQILRNLVTHNLLLSTRGVDGGYTLTHRPEEITLMDVLDAFDNPLIPTVPILATLPAATEEKLKRTLSRAAEVARQELASLSLADLVRANADQPDPVIQQV